MTCKQCNTDFDVSAHDQAFHAKMNVPAPSLCPDCRNQRRLAWRNESALYKRNCDLTGKPTVSFYRPDSPYTVYAKDEWWKDGWDGKSYGREFDFSRSFFEQFDELLRQVPHMSLFVSHGENNDYCPYSVYYKNSYMCMSGVVGEDMYYCYWTNDSQDCMDCYASFRVRQCYECIQCINVYNSIFCKDCDNSSDLAFCLNCDGCKNCIGCYGLRHKEYYVFNEKVTPEEFHRLNAEIRSSSKKLEEMKQKFKAHVLKYPQQALQLVNTENCTGDYLLNCRNSHDCYLSEGLEDCAFTWNIPQSAKDSQDINYSPKAELAFNCMSATNGHNVMGLVHSWDMSDSAYCFESFYSKNLFGCAGLKHQQYCILNKQFTKEEYEALVPKIIDHMKATGEWGEFFPPAISPFAYNETIANDWFPLPKADALGRGWKWSDYQEPLAKVEKVIPAGRLPDIIKDIPDDIVNWAVECEVSGKPFRIIPQELRFYRTHGLPIPHKHPTVRYQDRLKEINPRKLWPRSCAKCGAGIQTSYSPDRPEKVYCESCYLKEVY